MTDFPAVSCSLSGHSELSAIHEMCHTNCLELVLASSLDASSLEGWVFSIEWKNDQSQGKDKPVLGMNFWDLL